MQIVCLTTPQGKNIRYFHKLPYKKAVCQETFVYSVISRNRNSKMLTQSFYCWKFPGKFCIYDMHQETKAVRTVWHYYGRFYGMRAVTGAAFHTADGNPMVNRLILFITDKIPFIMPVFMEYIGRCSADRADG